MEERLNDLQKRHHRVINYIYDNIDGDLSLDTLAEIACYSRFHWHRVYYAMTGETIAQTVRRLRFARAANELVRTNVPLKTIARHCGFSSTQSFSHGFRAEMGSSPSAYRKTGKAKLIALSHIEKDIKMYEVKIEEHPKRRVASLEHQGDYMGIGQKFERLAGIAFTTPEILASGQMIGVYYSDPSVTPLADLRSAACLELKDGMAAPIGTDLSEIEGGRYACLVHKGDYSLLSETYNWLYGAWLAKGEVEMRDLPAVEIYLNSPSDTQPEDLQTKICLPIK